MGHDDDDDDDNGGDTNKIYYSRYSSNARIILDDDDDDGANYPITHHANSYPVTGIKQIPTEMDLFNTGIVRSLSGMLEIKCSECNRKSRYMEPGGLCVYCEVVKLAEHCPKCDLLDILYENGFCKFCNRGFDFCSECESGLYDTRSNECFGCGYKYK